MLSSSQNNQVIRNYIIALVSVMLLSTSLADVYNQPSRAAQKDRLDNYSRWTQCWSGFWRSKSS